MSDPADMHIRPPAMRAGEPGSAVAGAGTAEPDQAPEPAGEGGDGGSRPRWWPFELRAFLELFALCGFVVVQPLLEVVGDSPDFFIFHGVTAVEVLLLVAVFALVPPVGLWGLGALSGLAGSRVRQVVHAVSLGLLFILFVIQLGKYLTPIRGTLLAVLAVLVAAVMLAGYILLDLAKQLLRFAAVGPLVFALLFVFASPSSAVVFPDGSPGAGGDVRSIGPHPPIVMILLDELAMLSLMDETGGIDSERFPNIARLADDSTWWRNATTVAGWTPYAVPAMLTGRMPSEHVAAHHAVFPDNLFTLLGDHYRIEASETISQLCPAWHCGDRVDESRGGLPVALAESTNLLGELVSPVEPTRDPYDDYAEPTMAEQIGEAAAAREERPEFLFQQALGASQPVRFHDFVSGLSEPSDPAVPPLHFLHMLLPHTPWNYLPDGTRYQYPTPRLPVDGEWWGRLALQRYLLQLEYTDVLIGETMQTLQAEGLYDDALVVLTSDHGVALTPGPADDSWVAGSRELGPDDYGAEELMWVPLFIKEPGQTEGRIDERNWQHVDLLPTLADYAGVELPWEVDGISWLREERTTTEKTFVSTLRDDDDDIRVIDAPPKYQRILADPDAIPPVPEAPLPELVGTAVDAHPVLERGGAVEVANSDDLASVDPASGVVPALVHGTVPGDIPTGTPLAIAVNGRIGAVVPVVAGAEGDRRFAGLIEDTSVFVSGDNQLELFLVADGALHRVG